MMEARSLGAPDDVLPLGRGRVEVVNLSGVVVARTILEPGWRWSEDAGPAAGTVSCRASHAGYVISGRLHVRMDDGSECDLAPGDAHVVGAGHDAWVTGNQPAVVVEFSVTPGVGDAAGEDVRSSTTLTTGATTPQGGTP